MKKKLAVVLAASLAMTGLVGFAGCGEGDDNKNDPNNTAPVISGVKETAMGEAGVEFNALAGVTAHDEEDGDLTSSITVEADGLTFTNGKATPSVAGDYELIYSVKDSGNETAYAYCTLTVSRALAQEVAIVDYDSEDFVDSGATVNKGNWNHAIAAGAAATADCKPGAYLFHVTNPGTNPEDVALKETVTLPAGEHAVTVWAKADKTTYAKLVFKKAGAVVETTEATAIGTAITQIKLEFTLAAEAEGEIALCLGKMDNTPAAYDVTVTKIERVQTTGEVNKVDPYVQDFSTSAESVTAEFWDDSAGNVTNNEGAAQVNITSYRSPDKGGVWSTHFWVALGNHGIVNGKTYAYSVDVTAQNAQTVEFYLVGGQTDDKVCDSDQAGFGYSLAFNAGVKKTLTGTFTLDKDVAAPVLRFQAGNASAGVTSNVYTIDNVEFYEVGAGTTEKTDTFTDRFEATGGAEQPWAADNNGEGIGAFYTEEGKLVYRIDQLGGADFNNKITFKDLAVPADAYVTVSLTVKASKNVSCAMHLFRVGGGWDVEDDRPTKSLSDANPAKNRFEITTEEQTLSITLEKTLLTEGTFELLLQDFKCADGSVTIEISALKVTYRALS